MNARPRKALYVSAFIPNEHATHAGGQAACQNVLDLERAGYQVTVLVCTTEHTNGPYPAGATILRQSRTSVLFAWGMRFLAGRWRGLCAWLWMDTRANRQFEQLIRDEIQMGQYELLFADFTQVMPPVLRAVHGMTSRPTLRCCAHDLYIQKCMRDGTLFSKMTLDSVIAMERELLNAFDEVVVLSDKDKQLAEQHYSLSRVQVRPWTAPWWVHTLERTRETIRKNELLFFANFGRPENTEAVSWLLQVAWPEIQRQVPGATLVLAGAHSESLVLPTGVQGIVRHGFLHNPKTVFETCHAAIVPLAHGAGVKFKVLEALACGVPVLGTAVALEGVPCSELTVEADREALVPTLVAWLKSN